jgi:hypothetical protein
LHNLSCLFHAQAGEISQLHNADFPGIDPAQGRERLIQRHYVHI